MKKTFFWRSVHRKCTEHSQLFNSRRLDASVAAHYAWHFMYRWWLAAAALAAAVIVPARAARGADDATLLRVFLKDGSSLVSYGEPARVNDRVIFSMPTAPTPNPPLHLVNLPLNRIDWQRTERYAAAARSTHYLQTQAETDYAALSSNIAQTLNEVAATAAP